MKGTRMIQRFIIGWMVVIATAVFAIQTARSQTWEVGQLGHDTIDLKAYWEPMTDAVYGFDKKPLIRDLRAAEKRKTWRSSDFQPMMPPQSVKTGDVWKVDPERIVPLLKQFHSGAQAKLHHGAVSAPGGWACLSALDQQIAEIRFRVHAEFLLDGDGDFRTSSWFTPAQFQGRLRIDVNENKVIGFQMGVPLQSANVDINLPVGADIGRIPRMEIVGGSFPELPPGTSRISDENARKRLAQKFYRFAEINWLNLAEARGQSMKTGKPLHVIALFGSLGDESC